MSALNLKIHPDSKTTSYSAEEEDDSGIHIAYYNVIERNLTNLHLTKKWSSDDYLEHADGRPIDGERHSKSHYRTSLEIENGAIRNATRSHFSYLHSDKPYYRPGNKPEIQQPDFELKASGESHLSLICCISPHHRRTKRSSEKSHFSLKPLKQDTLSYSGMQHLKWSSVGVPNKPSRTFYELLRCYSDSSVKENELSKCVKELHYLAKNDDEIYQNIVNLTLERSHLNFSTWSGLVGSIVVRGDYQTQKIISQAIISEEPRPLSKKEHAKLLEAVYFIPAGPLYPELLQALLSLHKNSNKSNEITVRAMLVTSGLVRRCHDAGYNRSLSESIAQYLNQSFKTHPARLHDRESPSHDEYIWSHVCAFGNLGHISSLNLITRYLDHDSSGIRYFAVSALRKLPTQHTDHHLLRILRNDEHVTVKAGVIEVFIERRQNITDELRDAIEDALWISKEGDELDSKITEFLENHDEKSFHVMQKLRKRRSSIRRRKRALIPALKPREFSLGVEEEWRKTFGGSRAGAEAIMRFVNGVKLRIGIFGGSFEVILDNFALFRAHVIMWSFDIVNGKAAFRMGAGFKNDIPKDIIHTVADAADSFLATVDAISSIVTQHIERFLNILKKYLPFNADSFINFIEKAVDFISRTTRVKKFAESFNRIVKNLQSAWRASEFWSKISNLVKKLSLSLSNINLSIESFSEAFRFLNKLLELFSRLQLKLPHNFPLNFNIRQFMIHINGPFDSTNDAVESYYKKSGFRFPKNFFDMFHFNFTLKFIPTLDGFKITTARLLHFANTFLEMLSVFRNMFNIVIPRLDSSEFNINVDSDKEFDFGLAFDWRLRFNFDISFSGPDFAIFKNLFRLLAQLFQNLSIPNINFEQFFEEILPEFRIKFEKEEIFRDAENPNSRLQTSSRMEWFKLVMKIFHDISAQFNSQLFDLSNTKEFLDALSKNVEDFSKGTLETVCKLQDFILKSAGKLEVFGETLEKDSILGIKHVKNNAKQVIIEVFNISVFVDEFIDELIKNVSGSAKIFVEKYLTELEGSLENVKLLADIIKEFSSKSANKLTGLCYKTADVSGDILDKIQSEAQNALNEVAGFFADNSDGFVNIIGKFKNVVKDVEVWYEQNFATHVGKVAIISKTIDEFLSLIKTDNKIFSDIHKVFTNINNVIQQLNNLPMHAQQAYDFADKITDFVTNGKNWETKVAELNIRKAFKLDFDEQLQKLCDGFHSFAEDGIKQINSDNLFKTFREIFTKETDHLILQTVDKLNLLKIPLEKARSELDEMYNSVEEIEAVLVKLRPFSRKFLPILKEIRRLPNCSDIHFIFNNIANNCGKEAITFGKNTYNEYITMMSEVTAFLELLPDEWESLSLQKCISGGTCLSNSLKKQVQSVSSKMETLKKKFSEFNFVDKLETCKNSVEEVSRIFDSVKNISKLVMEFSFKEEIIAIEDLSRRITGKLFGNGDDHNSHVGYILIVCSVLLAKIYVQDVQSVNKLLTSCVRIVVLCALFWLCLNRYKAYSRY